MSTTDPFRTALDAIPEGHSLGLYQGRRWRVKKTCHAAGRSLKLYVRDLAGSDLAGTDFVSLNLYHLAAGDLLKPCEMAEAKVRACVTGFQPDRG